MHADNVIHTWLKATTKSTATRAILEQLVFG